VTIKIEYMDEAIKRKKKKERRGAKFPPPSSSFIQWRETLGI